MRSSGFFSASVGLAALLCLAAPSTGAQAAPGAVDAASDLPIGLRIGLANVPRAGADGETRNGNVQAVVFADMEGRPLFSLAAGAACAGPCLEKWRPALAPADAVATKDWTLVSLASGQRQWAFQGRPTYTAVAGKLLDQPLVVPEYNQTPFRAPGTPSLEIRDTGENGMHLARVTPKSWIKTPFSIGVAEYRLAPGQLLAVNMSAANTLGQPLYAFSGTPQQEQALPEMFTPLYASALSLPVGDFTIRERDDATRQWVYRGGALYSCSCDVSTGDLNGEGASPALKPAVVLRYPTPSQVAIKKDVLSVGRMVEARTGMTLYYRDRALEQYVPDNSRPPNGTMDPGVGAQLGLKHCDAKCEKEWRPFLAPANAEPQGYWSIYDRPDRKRQWAYKNSAVYIHTTEQPGSLDGNEDYLIQIEDGYGNEALPTEFGLGLMWRALVP